MLGVAESSMPQEYMLSRRVALLCFIALFGSAQVPGAQMLLPRKFAAVRRSSSGLVRALKPGGGVYRLPGENSRDHAADGNQEGISNVRVLGATATQAILAYTAPSDAPCTLEVSESLEFSPLVHDLNPALFQGANLDSRPGNLASGRDRVFVIGKRTAQQASDGRYYSRALQTATLHYYRITCGDAPPVSDSFWTANLPLGITRGDALLANPDNPGETLQPSLSSARSQAVIDPSTGVLLKRLTMQDDISRIIFNLGSGGAASPCSRIRVQTSDGKWGFHCLVPSNYADLLYWVGETDGEVRLLANFVRAYQPPEFGGTLPCHTGRQSFDPLDANKLYCMWGGAAQKFLRATYTGHATGQDQGLATPVPQTQGMQNATWEILTPEFRVLTTEFEPASAGETWSFYGVEANGLLGLYSSASYQDRWGWKVLFDPHKADTMPHTPGCVKGGKGCVVAMINSMFGAQYAPNRWCVIHTPGGFAAGDWSTLSTNPSSAAAGTNRGGHWWTSSVTLPACTPGPPGAGTCEACPENPLGVTGNQCSTVTVDGEPQDQRTGAVLQPMLVGDMVSMGNSENRAQRGRILVRRGIAPITLVLQRGYDDLFLEKLGSRAFTGQLLMACGAPYELWWNWKVDPHGQNLGNNIRQDLDFDDGHCAYLDDITVGANSWPEMKWQVLYKVRRALIPPLTRGQVFYSAAGAPFAGKLGFVDPNTLQSHASLTQMNASEADKLWAIDARSFRPFGNFPGAAPEWSSKPVLVSGQLYKIPGAGFERKHLDTVVTSGAKLLLDISSPATGDVISDQPEHSYKYCVALKAGECRAGSSPGEIYANIPSLTKPFCADSIHAALANDICVWNVSQYAQGISQIGISRPDPLGQLGRVLSHGLSTYNSESGFWNARAAPDGRWLIMETLGQVFLLKIPPLPEEDGVNRTTFVPIPVAISTWEGLGADQAVIEFGYDPDFHCTSRREACVAHSEAIDEATPFHWSSEARWSAAPCASGCTITIPAIPQRILYWRVVYRKADGTTPPATTDTWVLAVP